MAGYNLAAVVSGTPKRIDVVDPGECTVAELPAECSTFRATVYRAAQGTEGIV